MTKFEITIGEMEPQVFQGANEREAILAMVHDAGYMTIREAAEVCGKSEQAFVDACLVDGVKTFTVFSGATFWGTYDASNPKDAVRQAIRDSGADIDCDVLRAFPPGSHAVSRDAFAVFEGSLVSRPVGEDYVSFD